MTTKIVLGAVFASVLMVGCGSNNSNTLSAERFSTVVMMGDTLERDTQSNLEWIGSAGSNGTMACQPHAAATTEIADIAGAEAHCSALIFAGHDDWRVATALEHQSYIQGMDTAGLTPFYANPACPRLIGSNGTTATAVNTHNASPVGGLTPWNTLLTLNVTNYGVKCVRTQ